MDQKEEISLHGKEGPIWEEMQPKSRRCRRNLDEYATKNVIIISLCFLLNFTAFVGLQFLQSSLHREGLGLVSLSILYAVYASSTLLGLAPAIISKIGHKWSMVAGMSTYLLFVLANGHATWFTMIPAAALQGLGSGPLWVAKAAYFTITATNVASRGGEDMEVITHRYFGVFYCTYCLSTLIGPAISSAVLHVSDEGITVYNSSSLADLWSRCGAQDCPNKLLNQTAIEPQDPHKVWLLVGVYGGCALLALFIMAIALDNVTKPESVNKAQTWQTLFSVLRQHRHWRQILLVPLSLQQGWTFGFIYGEFFKSFGSCVFGVWMVGVIVLPFGLTQSGMCLVAGVLVKYTGRLSLMMAASVSDMALLMTFLFWNGHGGQYAVYAFSCLLGVNDAIRRIVLNGTMACLFPKDSEYAFCAYRFWESVAFMVPFAYSKYLCTSTKIWIVMIFTVLACCCFIVLEKPCCTRKGKYGTVSQHDPQTVAKPDQ